MATRSSASAPSLFGGLGFTITWSLATTPGPQELEHKVLSVVKQVATFADFVRGVAGARVSSETLYGFRLVRSDGAIRPCFGFDGRGSRCTEYIDALRARGGPTHPQWAKVPSRAQLFWRADLRYIASVDNGVFVLKNGQ